MRVKSKSKVVPSTSTTTATTAPAPAPVDKLISGGRQGTQTSQKNNICVLLTFSFETGQGKSIFCGMGILFIQSVWTLYKGDVYVFYYIHISHLHILPVFQTFSHYLSFFISHDYHSSTARDCYPLK